MASIDELADGGDGPLAVEHALQRPQRNDERHVGPAVACGVGRAGLDGLGVDRHLQRATRTASSDVADEGAGHRFVLFFVHLRFCVLLGHPVPSCLVGTFRSNLYPLESRGRSGRAIIVCPRWQGKHDCEEAQRPLMQWLVTGGAGFIGSHMVDRIVEAGGDVLVLDDLSSGRRSFLEHHLGGERVRLVEVDLRDFEATLPHFQAVDRVVHLAANPDIRLGTRVTDTDLNHGTVATYNVLESMRRHGVEEIAFASSSVVYGENAPLPTPENHGPCIPISLYGASKTAGEGLLGAYVGTFGLKAWIFRFANIIGSRGTHGVIFDFIHKLQATPDRLEVLGNGRQEKSYMLVEDCVDAMMHGIQAFDAPLTLLNLGTEDTCSVTRIAEIVIDVVGAQATIDYTGGDRGWAGDIPRARLAIDRLLDSGFTPTANSEEAVRRTAELLYEEIVGPSPSR